MTSTAASLHKPLVVDLDGTLVRTDLLVESFNQFLIHHPFQCWLPLWWLTQGKVVLKEELAQRTDLDVSALPYNAALIEWLRSEKKQGRRLILATASHTRLAHQVAAHLQLFDEVLATDHGINLKAQAKADALVARFGKQGFDYVGNDWPDLAVWACADTAHVVDASDALIQRAKAVGTVGQVFESQTRGRVWSFLKAIRIHQWMKNLLVFVPLLAAHEYTNWQRDQLGLLAFVIFSITASSVYLLNDLVDVPSDRHHLRKRERPFAAGDLSLLVGWLTWPVLLLMAIGLSLWFMPVLFTLSLGVYFVLTVAYSLYLKQLAIVDVLTLAALYTLRIMAGAAAIDVPVSFWLLLFSMFVFLSLALIKRYSELLAARTVGKTGVLRGRGYRPEDLDWVSNLGSSAGLIAVLVLALYIQDGQAAHLYAAPKLIWLVCPALLFWMSRAWMIAHRGQMHEDPIVFALKDKVSWCLGAFMLMVFGLARVMS